MNEPAEPAELLDAPELLELPIGDEAADVGDAGDAGDQTSSAESGLVPRELFAAGLAQALTISGQLGDLRTLREASSLPTFGPAADTLYDLALETPWLRWLIEPQSLALQRLLIVGAFALPVGMGSLAELRERRAAAAAKPVNSTTGGRDKPKDLKESDQAPPPGGAFNAGPA